MIENALATLKQLDLTPVQAERLLKIKHNP
jgi:hypothetical protein